MTNRETSLTKTRAASAQKPAKAAHRRAAAAPKKAKLGRPSQRNPGETRSKILASALKCFTEKGFAATTFAAVGREAGLTGPAIYQYFDSKGALYAATLEHIYEVLVPDISIALIDNQNFKARLHQILLLTADLHESNPAATAFLSSLPVEVRQEPTLKQHLSNRSSTVLSALTRVFDDAKTSGEISSARSTDSLSMFFFGSVMGLCLYHHASQKTAMREAIEVFLDIVEGKLLSD
ncbi:HTH-type transcriptional regulator TtgR [Halioglobus japonicus]|nr:HTH-type transcriptional regulator TtgR [Halioglobus japonicus]